MKKLLLNLLVLTGLSTNTMAQVVIRADLDTKIGTSNEKQFGANYFLEEDPSVGANVPRKNLEAQMQFKIIRYHTAELFNPSSPRCWLDVANQKWNFPKIKQALAQRPANCDILINLPGWPVWMDTNNDSRLDAGQETNYYNFCAILVDSVNNRWGYNVKYWEPYNEKDGTYVGVADMKSLADYYKGARTAMKAKDNTIKCVAGAFIQPYKNDVESYLENFTPTEMDVWSHHLYGGGCTVDTTSIYDSAPTIGSGTSYARYKLNSAGLSSVPMWLDEWNMFYTFECDLVKINNVETRFQSNIVGGIFFGLAYKSLLEDSQADAIMCWNFVDDIYGIAKGTDPLGGTNFTSVVLKPSGQVLRQFRTKGIGDISPTTSSDDKKVQGISIKRADGTCFFVLINRSGQTQSVRFNAGGWSPANSTVDVQKMAGTAGLITTSTAKWSNLTGGAYSIAANSLIFITTRTAGSVANYLPLPIPDANRKVTLPYTSMALQGKASDKDGTINSYAWAKVSGPTVTLSNTSRPSIVMSNVTPGTYKFKFEVRDNLNALDLGYTSFQAYGTLAGLEMNRTSLKTSFSGTGTDQNTVLYEINSDGNASRSLENDQLKAVLTNLSQFQSPFRLTFKDAAAVDLSVNSILSIDIKSNVKIDLQPKLFDVTGKQIDVYATTVYIPGDNTYRTYSIDFAQYANKIDFKKVAGIALMQIDGSKTDTRSGTIYMDNLMLGSGLPSAPTSSIDFDRMISVPSDSVFLDGSGNDANGIVTGFLWSKISGPALTLAGTTKERLKITGYALNNTYSLNFRVTDNDNNNTNKVCKLYAVNTGTAIPTTTITERYLKARYSGSSVSDSVLLSSSAGSSVLSIDQGQMKATLTNLTQYSTIYAATIKKGASIDLTKDAKFSVVINSNINADIRVKLIDLAGNVLDNYIRTMYVPGNNTPTTYNFDFKDIIQNISAKSISRVEFMSVSDSPLTGSIFIDNLNLGSVPSSSPNRDAAEEEKQENQSVIVYPNPTNDHLTIKDIPTDEGKVSIQLFDGNGRDIASFLPEEGQTEMTIKTEKYQTGLYFINVQTNKQKIVRKVIILK